MREGNEMQPCPLMDRQQNALEKPLCRTKESGGEYEEGDDDDCCEESVDEVAASS